MIHNRQPYDSFFHKPHSKIITKILLQSNRNILSLILNTLNKKKLKILEIGPGKGYFFNSLKAYNISFKYSALDQNRNILNGLGIKSSYLSILPKLPIIQAKYDLIYAAYVIEHLKNGTEFYELAHKLKKLLNKNGLMVLLVPNTPPMGMEFWDNDYTHMFPTSIKNVSMVLNEQGYNIEFIYAYNDLGLFISNNPFIWKVILRLSRLLFFWYKWRFFAFLFTPIYRVRKDDMTNLFFQFHLFIQNPNLMFIVTKSI